MKKVIALVTDFGIKSAYSGIMKGVIWSVNPHANIADLSHGIDPGDISEAYYIIRESVDYYPPGTVFTVVVDPGVGSDRRIIALEFQDRTILVPDNGLAWAFNSRLRMKPKAVYSIINDSYFLKDFSNTFHGRDVFAPVAAWLSAGSDIKKMGEEVDPGSLSEMILNEAFTNEEGNIEGTVVRIDAFGNLITNIHASQITGSHCLCLIKIMDSGKEISGISGFYGQVGLLDPLAIIGSSGYLEISVNRGRAEQILSVSKGSGIMLINKN